MKLADVKILSDIGKVIAEIYAIGVDKSRQSAAQKEKIVALEKELAELKAKVK